MLMFLQQRMQPHLRQLGKSDMAEEAGCCPAADDACPFKPHYVVIADGAFDGKESR